MSKVITIYWHHVFPTSGELEYFRLFELPSPGLSHTHNSKKYHVLTLLICRRSTNHKYRGIFEWYSSSGLSEDFSWNPTIDIPKKVTNPFAETIC